MTLLLPINIVGNGSVKFMLKIQKEFINQIQRHGEKTFPEECIGVLLGKQGASQREVIAVLPLENSAASKEVEFSVSPKELQKVEQAAILQNLDVIGFYHSHANFEAVASEKDKAFAFPGFSYPIVQVLDGKATDIKSYSFIDDFEFKKFSEEELICQ